MPDAYGQIVSFALYLDDKLDPLVKRDVAQGTPNSGDVRLDDSLMRPGAHRIFFAFSERAGFHIAFQLIHKGTDGSGNVVVAEHDSLSGDGSEGVVDQFGFKRGNAAIFSFNVIWDAAGDRPK